MSEENESLAENLTNYFLTALAGVMFLSLPVLWVAWSRTVFLVILATGIGCGIVYCLLYALQEIAQKRRA